MQCLEFGVVKPVDLHSKTNTFFFLSFSFYRSEGQNLCSQLVLYGLITSSLSQPVKGPGRRCTDAPANRIFYGPITSIFNAMRFDENPLTCLCGKEGKKT